MKLLYQKIFNIYIYQLIYIDWIYDSQIFIRLIQFILIKFSLLDKIKIYRKYYEVSIVIILIYQ